MPPTTTPEIRAVLDSLQQMDKALTIRFPDVKHTDQLPVLLLIARELNTIGAMLAHIADASERRKPLDNVTP